MANRRETRLLTRVTDGQGCTLHFICDHVGARAGNSTSSFIDVEHVPAFEGREAWFELERVPAAPWPYWRAVRQVDPPPGWRPDAPRPPLTPAQRLGHRS